MKNIKMDPKTAKSLKNYEKIILKIEELNKEKGN